MDDMEAVVSVDRTQSAGTEETPNDSLDHVDNENKTGMVKNEDGFIGSVTVDRTQHTSATMADGVHNMGDAVESAADLADIRRMEMNDHEDSVGQSGKDDTKARESDGECSSESTCLEAMTPYGQDFYLRLGDTPRRRSALRLSRIIARQQLLRRLSQGRNREAIMCKALLEFQCN